MLRVLMDTNIYGKLIEEKTFGELTTQIRDDPEFKIYGFSIIRKELRDTPKTAKLGKFSKRNLLLNLFDELTDSKYLKDSLKIHKLAMKVYGVYRKFGGIRNWNKTNIDADFTIVACAMFYQLDVLVSDDVKTMLSKVALKSYRHISVKEALRLPVFYTYSDLKMRYEF